MAQMRALVLVAACQFELDEIAKPAVASDEVLIRVRACGICGSDVHGMDGSSGRRIPPIVMGHEAAGEIAEVGAAVEGYAVGDRVTFDSTVYCGACEFCLRGEINLCVDRQVLGVSCGDYRRHGAFAEFVATPARILHRVPDDLPFDRAAMVEPVAIALHGAHRAGPVGRSAAVVGTGMIGSLVVQSLRALGWRRVVAVDVDPAKREFALQMGADAAFAPEDAPREAFEAVVEAVGGTASIELAIAMARRGGRVALVGNLSPRIDLPLQAVVTREIDLRGCCSSRGEYPEALALMASGAIRVEPMISARCSLDEAATYFARLHRREAGLMKVVVQP